MIELCKHKHITNFQLIESNNRGGVNKPEKTIFEELESALALLKQHFLSTKNIGIDEVLMIRKGLSSMLETLQDPFTNYIPPDQLEQYQARKMETLSGIGLEVEIDGDGQLRIISPLIGGPSDLPGVTPGRSIISVDGENCCGLTKQQVMKRLNGKENTVVLIELEPLDNHPTKVELVRKSVNVEYVSFNQISEQIVLARISWFSGTCHEQFVEQLTKLVNSGTRGLILDLRFNSGGSIIATRNIFSSLCDQEVMYLGVKNNEPSSKDRVLGSHLFSIPMVVIINNATFSAGEVLAGALKDHNRLPL